MLESHDGVLFVVSSKRYNDPDKVEHRREYMKQYMKGKRIENNPDVPPDDIQNAKVEIAPKVRLTGVELQKLNEKYGEAATRQRIERLSLYKLSNGKKYNSDYATILNWERMEDDRKKQLRKEITNPKDW